jgi:hypothetical protein
VIRIVTGPPIASFVTRLTARARAIGRAEADMRLRAARSDPDRWRAARLLWPLFGDR